MKGLGSKITVAIVCSILGFMLAYQFKLLNKQTKDVNINKTSTDITVEIEQYKKQKEQLEKSIDELQGKVKKYEDSAANKSEETKNLVTELETTRMLTGNTDVQGPGVIVYLNPQSKIFGGSNTNEHITDKNLVYLVNELRFAGAEAISINDIRITSRSGIRNSGNMITINDEYISPLNRITIKAIGKKELLYGTLSFPEVASEFNSFSELKFEKSDNIKIQKNNKVNKFEYAKPIK